MNSDKRETFTEEELEIMLDDIGRDYPPDDVVKMVTPWRRAMNQILIGIALCTITLQFAYLDYIFPIIGFVISLLGFRSIRSENRWFRACFAFTVVKGALFFPVLVFSTTVYRSLILTPSVTMVLAAVNSLLLIVELLYFRAGIRAVQRKAGVPERADEVFALIIWYVLVCLLAFSGCNAPAAAGAMLVAYFLIIRNIFRLSKELDEAGYLLELAPVKLPNGGIVLIIVSLWLIGGVLGYTLGSKYPMNWSIEDRSGRPETESTEDILLELGFPEYVLKDLTDEDIMACSGALQVIVSVNDEFMNTGGQKITESDVDGVHHVEEKAAYTAGKLRFTNIGVQIDGKRERWIIIHHFSWTSKTEFCGTESIRIRTAYGDALSGWSSDGEVMGRVLYDKDGKVYAAPYCFLGEGMYAQGALIDSMGVEADIFAAFSLPRNVENGRGYIAYSVAELIDDCVASSWAIYTHQRSLLEFPAMSAIEKQLTDGGKDTKKFITKECGFVFYPTDEGVKLINMDD